MKMKQFTQFADLVTNGTWQRLKHYGRPTKVGGLITPEDLYGLTFGDLIELQDMAKANDIKGICANLLGMTEAQYEEAPAGEVMAFAYWVARELEKIGRLFAGIKNETTAEERQAGIEKLPRDIFCTLDWWCLRMGITDHGDAERTPWIRIYKALQKDNEISKYQERLRKIYEQKDRQQRRRK